MLLLGGGFAFVIGIHCSKVIAGSVDARSKAVTRAACATFIFSTFFGWFFRSICK